MHDIWRWLGRKIELVELPSSFIYRFRRTRFPKLVIPSARIEPRLRRHVPGKSHPLEMQQSLMYALK